MAAFGSLLEAYESALGAVDADSLAEDPAPALAALLARDAVETALGDDAVDADHVMRLAAADARMRSLQGPLSALEALDGWRDTVRPPETAW